MRLEYFENTNKYVCMYSWVQQLDFSFCDLI